MESPMENMSYRAPLKKWPSEKVNLVEASKFIVDKSIAVGLCIVSGDRPFCGSVVREWS